MMEFLLNQLLSLIYRRTHWLERVSWPNKKVCDPSSRSPALRVAMSTGLNCALLLCPEVCDSEDSTYSTSNLWNLRLNSSLRASR